MFNTALPGLHRWLVLPAILLMLYAPVHGGHPGWVLVLAPPLATLPFLGLIVAAPPDSLLRRSPVRELAAAALHTIAWLGFAWSWIIALVAGPYGVIAAGVLVPVLMMPADARDGVRMGMITMWLGLIGLLATWPLAWFQIRAPLFGVGAALLLAGGAVWTISARLARADEALPRAVVH